MKRIVRLGILVAAMVLMLAPVAVYAAEDSGRAEEDYIVQTMADEPTEEYSIQTMADERGGVCHTDDGGGAG